MPNGKTIELDIQPYCHECLMFEPELIDAGRTFDEKPVIRYVTCENRRVCDSLVRYLNRQLSEKENDDAVS